MNLPLRFYWAYNPSLYRGALQAPLLFDQFQFANRPTYQEALNLAAPIQVQERRFLLRFAIGRTF